MKRILGGLLLSMALGCGTGASFPDDPSSNEQGLRQPSRPLVDCTKLNRKACAAEKSCVWEANPGCPAIALENGTVPCGPICLPKEQPPSDGCVVSSDGTVTCPPGGGSGPGTTPGGQ